jgi:RNA polymerase sigma-70 factor (ECF subfamily)
MVHLDHLYRVAFHLAKDPHRAEDLAHETFVRALDASDRFSRRTNMKAWLSKILYNLFIDHYRQNKRWISLEAETADSATELHELPAEDPGPEALMLSSEINAQINSGLMKIPEEYRAAVVLVDMGEFSYEEAAEIVSCPVGTIRSRLSRGRKLLLQQLRPYFQTEHGPQKKNDL